MQSRIIYTAKVHIVAEIAKISGIFFASKATKGRAQYDSVTDVIKNYDNYFAESRKECIFATRKFMFSDGVHKF